MQTLCQAETKKSLRAVENTHRAPDRQMVPVGPVPLGVPCVKLALSGLDTLLEVDGIDGALTEVDDQLASLSILVNVVEGFEDTGAPAVVGLVAEDGSAVYKFGLGIHLDAHAVWLLSRSICASISAIFRFHSSSCAGRDFSFFAVILHQRRQAPHRRFRRLLSWCNRYLTM